MSPPVESESARRPASVESASARYDAALRRFLVGGDDADSDALSRLAREMALRRVPLPDVLAAHWETAHETLGSALSEDCLTVLERVRRSEGVVAEAYEQAARLDRRSHLRLASAYAQKLREVDALLDSLPAIAFLKDADFRYAAVNSVFCEALGVKAEEAIGKTDFELFEPEIAKRFHEQDRRVLAERTTLRHEDSVPFRGENRTVLLIKAPVTDSRGRPTALIGVGFDVTEQRRMVEALQRAVMVKTEFTSMVSHELRTPLTAIKEAIDIVADGTAGPVGERQADFLSLAKRNVDRLHRLINDTLDFSKLERGEFKLRLGDHDLNRLAREIVRQQRLAAHKQGLRLEMSAETELPPVRMDPDRISQVLVNLIGNAIRYCSGDWIEVETRREGDEAIVKVQDSGPGMEADELERIFDAFVQLSTGLKRKAGGTGLGLAIARRLIELHDGRIWVESEVGRGSAFYFALQLAPGGAEGRERGNGKSENSSG